MNEPTTDIADQLSELRRMLDEQRQTTDAQNAVIAQQHARIAQLESPIATAVPEEERSTRRGLLRLAGAAVVGGTAAAMLGAQPAAAANELIMASGNTPQTLSTGITSSVSTVTFHAINTYDNISVGAGTGLRGDATARGAGVEGRVVSPSSESAKGVWGRNLGSIGYGLQGEGGQAQLYLPPMGFTYDLSTSGYHNRGEFLTTVSGVFYCVAGGTPGTWRELGGIATAGSFHAITPKRVYDSRAAAPTPGLLATGSNRTVSVANGRDGSGNITTSNLVPAGATAVAANVTVTSTVGGGYLAINPGGNTVVDASTINWSATGQNLANGVTLTLNANREITVICGGAACSTHFIIDIAGYYL